MRFCEIRSQSARFGSRSLGFPALGLDWTGTIDDQSGQLTQRYTKTNFEGGALIYTRHETCATARDARHNPHRHWLEQSTSNPHSFFLKLRVSDRSSGLHLQDDKVRHSQTQLTITRDAHCLYSAPSLITRMGSSTTRRDEVNDADPPSPDAIPLLC